MDKILMPRRSAEIEPAPMAVRCFTKASAEL